MNLTLLLTALASALCNAAASICLRQAAQGRTALTSLVTPYGSLSDLYLVAIVLYGGSFVTYALALRQLSAPVAYPMIIGAAYVMTLAATWVLTREPLSWQTMAGGATVVLGLFLIAGAPTSSPRAPQPSPHAETR